MEKIPNMLLDPDKHPSFCKLLFKQGFMNKIIMPPAFIKEHKKMLAKTYLLQTDVAGKLWEAKIVRENSYFFICEGEWPQFVLHHKLELGDILLFFLIDKSTFQVIVFTQKTYKSFCERQLFEELSSSSEEEQKIGTRKAKKVKTAPKKSSGIAEEEEAGTGSDENGLIKTLRYSVVNLNNKDPYYETVVRKAHSISMTIPMSFARWTGIINMKRMTLVNEKGKKWQVDIVHRLRRVQIREGWVAFRRDNNIYCGDTCIFKLIKGQHGGVSNVLHVQKIPKFNSLH